MNMCDQRLEMGNNEPIVLPIPSDLIGKLTETERRVVTAMLEKSVLDTWEQVAGKVGISTRQLFNIRQSDAVKEAYLLASREMLRADIPDVLKKMVEKAKQGDVPCMRLSLELTGLLSKGSADPNFVQDIKFVNSIRSPFCELAGEETLEELGNLSTEQLEARLLERLKLAHGGIKPSSG